MSKFEKKAQSPAEVFGKAIESTSDWEAKFASLKLSLRDGLDAINAAEEERRRETDAWNYNERMRRQGVLDEQAREDRERELRFQEQEKALHLREKVISDFLMEAIGVNTSDPKAAQKALDAKIKQAEDAARAQAIGIAKKEYETQKALDAAGAKTELELLRQQNGQLAKENGELKAMNALLLDKQAKAIDTMGGLVKEGFAAAGAINTKATDALSTAAAAGSNPLRR